jgi:hypothetical protein
MSNAVQEESHSCASDQVVIRKTTTGAGTSTALSALSRE